MNFLTALQNKQKTGAIPVIPDIKCFSPKDGDLLRSRDPVQIARDLADAGAPALSVVTEPKEFGGSLELLRSVCAAVSVPVLRKDFVTDRSDLEETLRCGASAILLMVSCLGEKKLTELYHAAIELGLTPFVETHTEQELTFAYALGARLIGINNRDILQLERDDGDVSHAAALLRVGQGEQGIEGKQSQSDAFVIVESALRGGADARTAICSGADGVLCGTAILQAPDPVAKYFSMARPCELKVCGIMNEPDADLCQDLGVDMAGFVVEYPVEVPWNLTCARAEKLLEHVRDGRRSHDCQDEHCTSYGSEQEHGHEHDYSHSSAVPALCVVTGGSPAHVLAVAKRLRPDYLQLHGSETLEETLAITKVLHELGIRIIRSVPTDLSLRQRMFGEASLLGVAGRLKEGGVDCLLFDSRDAGNAASGGGSMVSVEMSSETLWDMIAAKEVFGGPIMLGGGITPENIGSVQERFPADCLDIMSGSEDAPGQKSPEKIRRMCEALTGVGIA